ncbi:hypothetical protein [Maribellus sediminis]|uniref:hypothetical protein n=1 Tax=Maribellus sediminis TaxID=2696285 RepID=UPI00142F9EF6|nr:hypothetical protein [Maribellus sediminis]
MNDRYRNIWKGNAPPMARLLLNMRDGPRGREPAIGFTRLATADGVPVTLKNNSFVNLCVHAVYSVVKIRQLTENHEELHRSHREFRGLLNRGRPRALHPECSGLAGGLCFCLKDVVYGN